MSMRCSVMSLRGRVSSFDLLDARDAGGVGRRAARCRRADPRLSAPVLDALGLDEHREAGRFLVAFDALLIEAGVGEALVVHQPDTTANALAVTRGFSIGPTHCGRWSRAEGRRRGRRRLRC